METRENIKIESHPFHHIICDWFLLGWSKFFFFWKKNPILKIFFWKFHGLDFENWRNWKTQFFWFVHFVFIFFSKKKKKILHPRENLSQIMWQNGWDSILMFSLVSSKFLAMSNILFGFFFAKKKKNLDPHEN